MRHRDEPRKNVLAAWLQKATPEQRERAACLAGTSVNYLYQLAAHRREPKVGLAVGLEDAFRTMHTETRGELPLITARDLAVMYAVEGLAA